jgi:hypothetical protein
MVLAAAVVALAHALAGCSEEVRAISAGKDAAKSHLKDPPSARFGPVFLVVKPVGKDGVRDAATCGVIDGKNGFGGYTGGSRFVVLQILSKYGVDNISVQYEDYDSKKAWPDPDNSPPESLFERSWWNPNCVDAAHPATRTGDVGNL